MGLKKIKKKLGKLIVEAYWEGWSDGYDKSIESQGDDSEFSEGWDSRSKNVEDRLEGLFEAYTASRKFREAQHVKEIIEYLNTYINTGEEEL
jgi:hypothetical protein